MKINPWHREEEPQKLQKQHIRKTIKAKQTASSRWTQSIAQHRTPTNNRLTTTEPPP